MFAVQNTDHTIELIVRLELANICRDLVEVGLLVFAGDDVVGSGLLVGGDEVGVDVDV